MCGIIGYAGTAPAAPVLLDGLKRLEYRGYDSAGIAVIGGHDLHIRRASGKVGNLEEAVRDAPLRRDRRHRPHPLGNPWQTD